MVLTIISPPNNRVFSFEIDKPKPNPFTFFETSFSALSKRSKINF